MPRPTDNPDHPENREQAVLELLRELQAGGPPRDEAADSAKSTAPQVPEQVHQQIKQPIHQQRSIPVAFLLPPSEVPTERVSCNSCGWENPADHSFCSMCGELLANHAAPDPRIADSIRAESSHRDPSLPRPTLNLIRYRWSVRSKARSKIKSKAKSKIRLKARSETRLNTGPIET